MALRTSAVYEFAPKFTRVIINNPDGSSPGISTVLSGVGPFDFSGVVAIAAVPVTIKIDNAAAIVTAIDLTAALDDAAVTAAEFVTAWGAIAVATGTTATVVNGRVNIAKTIPGTSVKLQVYGEAAEVAGFGYGYGAKIIKIDTQQSVSDAPTQKESERLSISDSNGKDTAIITDGYRTGTTYTLVDTAADPELRAVIEGGSYNATTKVYSAPTSESVKPTFTIEVFTSKYSKDENHEANLEGYLQKVSRACKGTFGERTGDRNLQAQTYNIAVTAYRDPTTLVIYPDTVETALTVAAYALLDVLDV